MSLGYAKRRTTNRKSGKTRSPAPTPNREYYSGANQTRNSVCNNPAAYASPKDPLFGVKTFGRVTIMPSEQVLDRAAEQEMNKGYSNKRNPVCGECWTRKSTTGKCNCNH